MKMQSEIPVRFAKYGTLAVSTFLFLLGTMMIIRTETVKRYVPLLLGIGIIAFGIIKLIGYFSKDLYRLVFQYDLEIGILLIFLGSITLLYPLEDGNLPIIAVGITTLTDSLFKIRIAKDAREFGISQWKLIRIAAFITCAVGVVLMLHLRDGTRLLYIVLGLTLIAGSLLNIFAVLCMVKISKKHYPDNIEEALRTSDNLK